MFNIFFNLFALIILFALGLVYGAKLLKVFRLEFEDEAENLLYAEILGLSFIGYIVFILGHLGLLYRSAVLGVLGVFLFLSFWKGNDIGLWCGSLLTGIRKKLGDRQTYKQAGPFYILIGMALLVFIYINYIRALKPITISSDSLIYHLSLPKMYVRNHKIDFRPGIPTSLFPFQVNMLYTLALMFKDELLAQVIHFGFGLLTLSAIIVYCRKYVDGKVALLACAFFYSTFYIAYFGSWVYLANAVALYLFCVFMLLWQAIGTGDKKAFIMAGVVNGLALSTKLSIIPITILIVLGIFVFLKFAAGKNIWYSLKATAFYSLIILAVSAPWYLRNFIWTGNPVFPVLNSVFKSKYYQIDFFDFSESSRKGLAGMIFTNLRYAVNNPFNWITYLWHFAYTSNCELSIGPNYIAFLPFLLFIKKNRFIKYLIVVSVSVSLLIFYTYQPSAGTIDMANISNFYARRIQMRYYSFLMVILSILAAVAVKRFIEYNFLNRVVVLIFILSNMIIFEYYFFRQGFDDYWVVENPSLKARYLQEHDVEYAIYHYELAQYANTHLPPEAKLFILINKSFYFNFDYIMGQNKILLDHDSYVTENEILTRYRELGLTHIVKPTYLFLPSADLGRTFARKYLKLLFSSHGVGLYKIQYRDDSKSVVSG